MESTKVCHQSTILVLKSILIIITIPFPYLNTVKRWRRSWDEPPPPMSPDSEFWPYKDPRYEILGIPEESIPRSESLKDVTKRTSQFWDNEIVPQLNNRKKVMIVGHENNLRSLIKRLDNVSDEDILHVELPRAVPLLYMLDPDTLKPLQSKDSPEYLSGKYLFDKNELARIAERDQRQVYDLSVKETLENLTGGIRAGLGYLGAECLDELKERARYIQVSPAGQRESGTHDVIEVKRSDFTRS